MHLGKVHLAILDSKTDVDGMNSCHQKKKKAAFDCYNLKDADFINGKEM